MQSIQETFNRIQSLNPCWSSHTYFVETILKTKLPKNKIGRYFNKLVEKDDYDKEDKRAVVRYLTTLVSV